MSDSNNSEQNKTIVLRGERLKQVREDRDLTQAVLAELVGVAENTITRYEGGNQQPKINTLFTLCRELNISADYLMGLTDEPYLLDQIIYKEVRTLPEWKVAEDQGDGPDRDLGPDLNSELTLMQESLQMMALLAKTTERSMVYERGFNYKTKRFLELWAKMTEREKIEHLRTTEESLKDRIEKKK